MTTDIKELVKEARSWHAGHSDDSQRMVWLMNKLCDALEAMAGEVERLKTDYGLLCDTLRDDRAAHAAERDRLKAALLEIKNDPVVAVAVAERALGGDA